MFDEVQRQTLVQLLDRYFQTVSETVQSAIAEKRIHFQAGEFERWRYAEYSYTRQGPSFLDPGIERYEDPVRMVNGWPAVLNELRRGEHYKSIEAFIEENSLDMAKAIKPIDTLAFDIVRCFGRGEDRTSQPVKDLAEFIETGEFICLIRAELDGPVVWEGPVEWTWRDTRFCLRETKREDAEKPVGRDEAGACKTPPSALFIIGTKTSLPLFRLRNLIQQSVAILSLYRTGFVSCRSYLFAPPAFLRVFPAQEPLYWGKRPLPLAPYSYTIGASDSEKLSSFWHIMAGSISKGNNAGEPEHGVLPLNCYEVGEPKEDHVSIAHSRYVEALGPGLSDERAIFCAVTGLEALLLRDGGGNLSYRLSMRVARIIGILGCDSVRAKECLDVSYKVRNNYTHGNLSENNKKDIKRKIAKAMGQDLSRIGDKYGQVFGSFMFFLLQITRVLVNVFMVLEEGDVGKDFLTEIDNAMIDQESQKKLEERLSGLRSKISLAEEWEFPSCVASSGN